MIANKIIIQLPRVDVDVLVRGAVLVRQRGADKHVVQLLRVHVVDVGVALLDGDADGLVEVNEARGGGEDFQGLDEGEFVEVAGGDDAGVCVEGEDLGDEGLFLS